MRKSQTRLRPAGAAGRARERGAGRWLRAEGRRSVGGVAGSDTQVPAAPEPPVPQTGAPSWGRRWEAGPGRALFSPGMLGSGWARGTWGRGPPSLPRDPLRSRCQAPCSSWRVGSPPPLPILLGGCHPKEIHPHTAAGKGLGPRPPAAHSLLPRRGREGGRWQARWTSKSQIHSLKGGKKAKIQKKKKYS